DKDVEESSLNGFRGREDFCGHESMQEDVRAAIRSFLTSEDLSSKIVWSNDRVQPRGKSMIARLFGKELNSELIVSFMMILHARHPHVRFLPTYVQINVWNAVEKMKTRKKWYKEDYEVCTSKLSRSIVAMLDELIGDISSAKFVFFPTIMKFHFFLVVLDVQEKKFIYHNSLDGFIYQGVGKSL
ncbi:Unknown protein, partial [Striga hermonthica]